ncbi:unnamed protein product [Arctogadus glacialis]
MAANGSSTASKSSNNAGGKPTGPTAEQVVGNFQRMRQEQRGMASKASEFEMENNEHSLVIETLKEVDPSRKCFRLVGGVLVERTVKEVLPALENNKEQITKIIETLSSQMQTKGRELTEYREKYNIRLVGEGEGEGQSADSRDSEGGASKGARPDVEKLALVAAGKSPESELLEVVVAAGLRTSSESGLLAVVAAGMRAPTVCLEGSSQH